MTLIPSENLPDQRPQPPAEQGSRPLPVGPLTATLMGLSVAVSLACWFGQNVAVLRRLVISEFDGLGYGIFLPEVEHGQVWRLLTPIFVHFGLAHLVFNLIVLKDLGTVIERVEGKRLLLAQVVVIGISSNLGQFLANGPAFGGMSGVVYGLLGYLWIKSRLDPSSRYVVPRQVVIWMLGWLVLCMTGWIGHVANFAHSVGLGVGAMWGCVSALASRQRARAGGVES